MLRTGFVAGGSSRGPGRMRRKCSCNLPPVLGSVLSTQQAVPVLFALNAHFVAHAHAANIPSEPPACYRCCCYGRWPSCATRQARLFMIGASTPQLCWQTTMAAMWTLQDASAGIHRSVPAVAAVCRTQAAGAMPAQPCTAPMLVRHPRGASAEHGLMASYQL